MDKNYKPTKRFKRKIKKFKCECCERIVINHKHIKVRKNYSHGKKSNVQVTRIHRQDGGVLVELKRKKNGEKK